MPFIFRNRNTKRRVWIGLMPAITWQWRRQTINFENTFSPLNRSQMFTALANENTKRFPEHRILFCAHSRHNATKHIISYQLVFPGITCQQTCLLAVLHLTMVSCLCVSPSIPRQIKPIVNPCGEHSTSQMQRLPETFLNLPTAAPKQQTDLRDKIYIRLGRLAKEMDNLKNKYVSCFVYIMLDGLTRRWGWTRG